MNKRRVKHSKRQHAESGREQRQKGKREKGGSPDKQRSTCGPGSGKGLLAKHRCTPFKCEGGVRTGRTACRGAVTLRRWYSDTSQLIEWKLMIDYRGKPQMSCSACTFAHFPQGTGAKGRKDGTCSINITLRATRSL